MNQTLRHIQNAINTYKETNPNESVGEISDTYHTFNELYHHRTTLLAIAMRCIPYAWKARKHEDGTMFDGMFIVGAPTPNGIITYHCDNEYWDLFKIPEIPHAPKFDGHTPDDVLDRLENMIKNSASNLIDERSMDKINKVFEKYILPVFDGNTVEIASFISFYFTKRA